MALFRMRRWAKGCFSCEQAAQMASKALFIEREVRSHPREHDLRRLGNLVHAPAALVPALDALNPLYMRNRYPDVTSTIPGLTYSETDCREAFDRSLEILRWVSGELGVDEPRSRLA